ncbi:hypothetical protein [Pandoraea communis]|uniref:hypothetical protein n=1 Tax=Pandoraea communis TaxID=2508297 RepID=UPI0012405BF9|nr:hypothetical protein [Pandoraea communis]MDM8357583.1 hypothetical protein [Pandoraea communis]
MTIAYLAGADNLRAVRFGAIRKLFVLLRGQVLFFDFKSMTVLRSYPVSFGYVDNLDHEPTRAEVLERVRMVYDGANGKPGLYARFASSVAQAQLPDQAPRYLQVTHVEVTPEAAAVLPDYLKATPAAAQTWVADMASEAISTRIGVPVVPYSKGYAIGNVMSMQIMDGTVFNLKLPQPDYEIDIALKNFKKIKYSENAVGTAYIYGSYADVAIREPLTGATYLNTSLKNGEVKPVPASQTWVDDKARALSAAQMKAVEFYYAEAGEAESENFDAIRQKILAEPDRYILDSTILAEEENSDKMQYTVAVRVSLNVANLRNAVKRNAAAATGGRPGARRWRSSSYPVKSARQLRTSDRQLVSYSGGWALSQKMVNVATRQVSAASSLSNTLLAGEAARHIRPGAPQRPPPWQARPRPGKRRRRRARRRPVRNQHRRKTISGKAP